MKKILFVVLVFLSALCFSQALSGTYIIGKSQPAPFNTITAAINRINAVGVSGPVTFLLNDDAYNNSTGENFPVKILQYSGSSTVNTLRIKPSTGKNVIISATNANSYTGMPAVFQLEGADNIIIDGSNVSSGTSRNLTILNNDGVEYSTRTTVWIASLGTNSANNIRILHTKLQMQNRNQQGMQLSGIFVGNNSIGGGNALGGGMATAAHTTLTFSNNEFINVRQGIIINGSNNASLKTSTVTVTGNQMGSNIDAQKPNVPLQISNSSNITITDNNFIGFANTSSANSQLGLYIENGSQTYIRRNIFQDFKTTGEYSGRVISISGQTSQLEVTENKITNVRNTVGGPMHGIELNVSASSAGISLINNFIGNIASSGTTTNTAHGIYINNGSGTKIYHNTVAMNTPQVGRSSALYIAGGSGLDIRNNIFTNISTLGNDETSYAVYSAVGASAFSFINSNNYHAQTIGYLGGRQTTLANWQNATEKDQNSLNVLPQFASVDDLHLPPANNSALDNKGQALAAVTIDIDQQARNSTTPDMGADEFSSPAAEPTSPAKNVTFTNVTASSFTVNWTNGTGSNRLVVIRALNPVNAPPTDGAAYTANSAFGSGSETGTGNFVVYSGNGTSVNVSNLAGNTIYHVAVYEFNGAGPTLNYLILNPATGSQRTLNTALGWQILSTDTVHPLNFDTTEPLVNNGPFTGSGFALNPAAGQLNSNAWSVRGLADGDLVLGGINTNPGFQRGSSNGGVSAGGVYAFMTSAGNAALGIQPTANDFNPGSVTLRMQNQTSVPITSLNIGYKVFIYNDQPGSSNFNFSHSADNSIFTDVSQLNVISPAEADENPTWKASYRVVTVTGLNIQPNAFYYLKWTGSTVTAGTADEFALDDITVSANPNNNFVLFQGVAEDFVLHGNANMNGNLTVNGPLTFNTGKLSVNNNTLTLNGPVNNIVAGGIKGSATSNLTVTGTGAKTISLDQTTPGSTNILNNFSVPFSATNSSTVDIFGNIAVNGSLNIGLSQQVNLGTNLLSGTLTSISINGEMRTQNTSAAPFPSGKTFSGTGTLILDALATSQTLVPGTYTNISLRSPAGTNAGGNITVNGKLELPKANPSATRGSLDMGTFTLSMGPDATNTGVGDVTGIITRNYQLIPNILYTFGHPDSSILFTNTGTLPTSMSAKVMIGSTPSWRPGAIERYYDIIQTGAANTKAVIRQHYLDSELDGHNESKLVFWAKTETKEVEQGRSNFNPTENWVEISNANIGLYFQSTFGKVFITLDEYLEGTGTDPLVLVWNGSVSESWITAENWTPNAVPSPARTLYIPETTTKPTLNNDSAAKHLIIQPGGVVNSPNTATLQIFGGEGAWINNGTFNSGSGDAKVVFMSADATMAGSTVFNHLEVAAGASLRALDNNNAKIEGVFTNSGTILFGLTPNTLELSGTNQVLPAPNGTSFQAYYNLIFSGTGTVVPSELNVRGNLTFNSAVDLTEKTLRLIGDEDQQIGGSAYIVLNNLDVNKPKNNLLLNKDVTMGGTLNLAKGVVVIGSNNLTLRGGDVTGTFGTSAMISADGTGMVKRPFSAVGKYFFPIGELTLSPAYSPVEVNITSGSFAPGAQLAVSLTDDIHPDNYSRENYISRYWKILPSGMSNAIATVTAKYIIGEALVAENTMAAAQLIGTFNQQSNPWKRFAPLENLTLTAAGAALPSGEISYFTGIKGGPYMVEVIGGGNYCEGQEALLSAQVTGGDMPFTYQWSDGLGTGSTATAPAATAGGPITYSLTVKDANGIATDNSATVTILPGVKAGTISIPNTVACASYPPDDITLSGNSDSVLYWQKSYFEDFSNSEKIYSTSTTLAGPLAGIITGKTYFRAVVGNANCGEAFTNTITVDTKTTVFDGSGWTNGLPDVRTEVVILNDYSPTEDLLACRLTVANNSKVTVPSGKNIILTGSLTVTPGAALTMESNSNLLQTQNEVNNGIMTVKRNSSPLYRLDYTMWGSPLYGSQTLQQFSPQTLADRFYIYNTATDLFNTVPPATTFFSAGQAFLIRMRNTHVSYSDTTPPQKWTGIFTGTPTNGPVSVTLSGEKNGYNMVANPYASTIEAIKLLQTNAAEIEGTLYFWRRRNSTVPGNTSAYYATYTSAGGTAVPSASPSDTSETPNGIIQVAQGFLVQKKAGGTGQLIFNNAMRIANNENQFFRGAQAEDRSRIWLNVTNTAGTFGQTLIAYMDSADNGVDRTDGKYLGDGTTALTSWLNDSEYIIQGRAPFQTSDIVPLHFRTLTAGIYTITLAETDGIFANGQPVYIKDKQNGTTHNLQQSAYSFSSEAGAFSSRFEIVYASGVLSANDSAQGNGILLFKQNGEAVVKSSDVNLDQVEVYDMNGRLVSNARNIRAKEVRLPLSQVNHVFIFKITTADGVIISKKMVN